MMCDVISVDISTQCVESGSHYMLMNFIWGGGEDGGGVKSEKVAEQVIAVWDCISVCVKVWNHWILMRGNDHVRVTFLQKKTPKKHVFDGKTGHQKVFMSQNVIVLEP